MPNVTSVHITAGIPDAGTGSVSTLDALMADGGQITLGAKADAAASNTDTTAISIVQVLKQVSKSVQSVASSIASTMTVQGTVSAAQAGTWTVSAGSVTQAAAPWLFNVVDGVNSTLKATVTSSVPSSTAVAQVVALSGINTWDIGSGTGSTKTIRTIIDSSQLAPLATSVQSVSGGVQMMALPTDQQPLPAAHVTDRLFNGTTSVSPVFAQSTTSLSGNTEIVASTSGKKIRVLNAALHGNGTVNAKWVSSTTDISPLAPVGSNYGYVLPFSPVGWFETASGAGLRLNLSVSQINVGVHIAYVLI